MRKPPNAPRPDDDGDPDNNQGRRLKPGDPDYVGYKHPPRAHRYPPGQCGNDKGRPKGSKNLKTRIAEAMSEPIELANGQVIMPEKLLVKTIYAAMMRGDLNGVHTFVFLHKTFGDEPSQGEDDLDGTRRRILDGAVARRAADRILTTLADQQERSEGDEEEGDAGESEPNQGDADD